MKKLYYLILAFLLIPTVTVGGVITENHWDTLNWPYDNKYNGATSTECAPVGAPIGYVESITCSSDPYCDSAPDPPKVLRITYKKGLRSGQTPAKTWYNPNAGPELWITYWFKYSSNYQWEPTQNKQFYLKNPVCQPASLCPGGLPPDTNNLIIFGIRGSRRHPELSIAGGGLSYSQNITSVPEVNIQPGRWYKMKMWYKTNTAEWISGHSYTNPNGAFKLWIDDVLISNYTGLPFRNSAQFNDTNVVDSFDMDPIWGGAMAGCVNQDMYLYYDNLILSTTPIGSDNNVMPISNIPSPPGNLSIQQ